MVTSSVSAGLDLYESGCMDVIGSQGRTRQQNVMIASSVTSTIALIENRLIQITTTLPRACAALSGSV